MPNHLEPIVGSWYKHRIERFLFEVVAVNEDDETIDIQLETGELSEMSINEWYSLSLSSAEEPEDANNSVFDLTSEDFGFYDDVQGRRPQSWDPFVDLDSNPADYFDDDDYE